MAKIVLGTSKWKDVERWTKVCEDYNVKYILNAKKSKIGFEKTWYQFVTNVDSSAYDYDQFMVDLHNKYYWKPYGIYGRAETPYDIHKQFDFEYGDGGKYTRVRIY